MSFNRQRLTWQDRKASAHPSYPDEGPASPAYSGADPEADAYENGDPSSWGEDPRPGPYTNSAHPAYPDEGPASPAYKAASLERKAAKCIRIASAMLGKRASVPQIENKALELMDLSDRAIHATLARLAAKAEEEEAEEEEAEEEEATESKKASVLSARVARLERVLVRLAKEEEAEEEEETESKSKKASFRSRRANYGMSSEESMLTEMMAEEMMAEEGMGGSSEEESMLEEMLMAEEGMGGSSEEEACGEYMDEPTDFDIGMESPLDPFEDEFMGEDEMQVLASIYGDKQASAPKAKQASRSPVAVKPQPKRASTGATRLGGVTKEASDSNDLSKLWESAPDISKHF